MCVRYGDSDYDSRTGDNKTRLKTGAGSWHGKSVQAEIRFVIEYSSFRLLLSRSNRE